VAKPVEVAVYDRAAAEAGGDPAEHARLVLIRTGGNLGFAGGNNVGLRYALARGGFDHVWLLNNDTVVEADALTRLVERMAERPDAGICGSLTPYYDAPGTIWTAGGGTFNRWLAKSCSLDDRRPVRDASPRDEVERRMDYVAGASMLVSKKFLDSVGLMCEEYFLYFEEPDWYFRGRDRFGLAYADRSIVYHKVGISTTRRDEGPDRSARSYYFRAQLLFTAKFFPQALPLVLVRVGVNRLKSAVRMMKRRSS
jgi:GT2 family glycosyltransferase